MIASVALNKVKNISQGLFPSDRSGDPQGDILHAGMLAFEASLCYNPPQTMQMVKIK